MLFSKIETFTKHLSLNFKKIMRYHSKHNQSKTIFERIFFSQLHQDNEDSLQETYAGAYVMKYGIVFIVLFWDSD
jgi:hypothetical protein